MAESKESNYMLVLLPTLFVAAVFSAVLLRRRSRGKQ